MIVFIYKIIAFYFTMVFFQVTLNQRWCHEFEFSNNILIKIIDKSFVVTFIINYLRWVSYCINIIFYLNLFTSVVSNILH